VEASAVASFFSEMISKVNSGNLKMAVNGQIAISVSD
jgi:hypothetical protein